MKILPILSAAWLAIPLAAMANTEMRQWKLADGSSLRAEILGFNEATGEIELRGEDKSLTKIKRDALSTPDKAWLLQWVEFQEETEALVGKLGGNITKKTGTGKFTTEYSVYRPSGTSPDAKLPLMIIFHPGGNGHRDILRYVEAADSVKMALVSCETFQNGKNNKEDMAQEAEFLERFKELLPQIEAAVPHDPAKVFMGGLSGGGWRAFHYSAQVDRPWAGIYSNCAWVGDKTWWDLPYPKMRVAFLNGDRDYGRNTNENDIKVIQKSGSDISFQMFEGGHQAAPPAVMTKAFRWLLGEIE